MPVKKMMTWRHVTDRQMVRCNCIGLKRVSFPKFIMKDN